jgi:hypothetical protein
MSSPDIDNAQPIIDIDDSLPELPSIENEAQTSASSFAASTLSSKSFSVQGGILKRNVYGKNEVWEYFQVYDEKKFKTHAFCILSEKLKEKTKARLGVALNVIQDVCTRWWSTFSICERLLRLKKHLLSCTLMVT